MRVFLVLYAIFLTLFALTSFISNTLYQHGYIHLNILFYAEKTLLAKAGEPPRLENIGFVYPPLAFLPFLIIEDYKMVSPLASSFLLTVFFSFLLKRYQSPAYFILLFLLLNPLVLFLAVYRFEVLAFYLLLTISTITLIIHLETGYSLYLFVSGFLFGLCFFLDFRSMFLIPVVGLVIYLSTKEKDISYRLALLIVKLFPALFFVFAWLYLNWIFTGDPFNFIKSPYSFFKSEPLDPSLFLIRGSFWQSLEYVIFRLLAYLPIILPYFIVLFNMRRYRPLYLMPVYLLYISPALLLFFSVYFSSFFPSYYYTILFVLFALSFQASFGIRAGKLFISSFLLSLASSWLMPLYSKEGNEKNFVKFFLKGETINVIDEYQRVAEVLKSQGCRKTLIDDAGGFPVVVFFGNPKAFYLPYMYEYFTVLSYPKAFADCVVTDKESMLDTISSRFPKARMGILEGYSLIYEGKRFNVFSK
jgi:hypothetical protein